MSKQREPEPQAHIPFKTWLLHKHSGNIFMVTKVLALHVETLDLEGTSNRKGFANKYLLARDIALGEYVVDPKGPDA
jgi:hypothetical protein